MAQDLGTTYSHNGLTARNDCTDLSRGLTSAAEWGGLIHIVFGVLRGGIENEGVGRSGGRGAVFLPLLPHPIDPDGRLMDRPAGAARAPAHAGDRLHPPLPAE